MTIHVRVRSRPDREHLQLWYRSPLTGRIITRSAETHLPSNAERAAESWQSELLKSGLDANVVWTWQMFRIRFRDEYLLGKPKATIVEYNSAFNHWEQTVGFIRDMNLVTSSVISQFSANLTTRKAPFTVAKTLRHLRAAFRWSEHMGMMRRAPRVIIPKTERRRLSRSRDITEPEFRLMKRQLPLLRAKFCPKQELDEWDRLFDVLWLSGLRIGEALTLSWDEPPLMVDLDSGPYPRLVIYAEAQKSREDETAVITPEFDKWLRKTPKARRSGPVVDLGEFDRSWVSHVLCECGKKAGIITGPNKHASAHDIRRSFGKRMAKIVRPVTLQKMMRHKDIKTTLAFYVDMTDEDVGTELWGLQRVQRLVQHSHRNGSNSKKKRSKNAGKKRS